MNLISAFLIFQSLSFLSIRDEKHSLQKAKKVQAHLKSVQKSEIVKRGLFPVLISKRRHFKIDADLFLFVGVFLQFAPHMVGSL